ncbi:hypothetical protein MHYP_G00333520 [Metynnis hypsauchen]
MRLGRSRSPYVCLCVNPGRLLEEAHTPSHSSASLSSGLKPSICTVGGKAVLAALRRAHGMEHWSEEMQRNRPVHPKNERVCHASAVDTARKSPPEMKLAETPPLQGCGNVHQLAGGPAELRTTP